ncbi:MAG TPA: ABC transporter ATP-binding protein [Devosiaceae bacterium]|jgi:NitT/TauT family transport system ATP-binding protein
MQPELSVELKSTSKAFVSRDNKVVVAMEDVSLQARVGEFVAIVGPSGCGKSTILNLLANIITPTSGEVLVRGKPAAQAASDIGYVFQQDTVLPWRKLTQNIELGLLLRRVPAADRRKRVAELVKMTGLSGFEDSYPGELSGGMRKRAALAMALAYDPSLILMDEPFGALDAQTRIGLHEELMALSQGTNKTILFVTHDITEAITLADRVVVMTARPARVKSEYVIDIARPRNISEVRFDPKFEELYKNIWDDLRPEVAAQQAQER